MWNTARVLERALAGQVLTGAEFRVPQLATVDLTGWTVTESTSRGKHLLLRLAAPEQPGDSGRPAGSGSPSGSNGSNGSDSPAGSANPSGPANPSGSNGSDHPADSGDPAGRRRRRLTLHSHLRMDGAWRAYRPGERWTARPAHLIRVVLRTERVVAVGFHLHEVKLIRTDHEARLLAGLGPDLLGADWDPAEAERRLAAQPDRPIAEALLDQRNLAGIGNLYKCEVLFLRGVWPWTPVREVPDLPAMVTLAQRLLAANRGRWVQSTTGSLRDGETSYVYGRRARACRRCGTPVRRVDPDPRVLPDRVTYWCPTCQPEPGHPQPGRSESGPERPAGRPRT